MNSGRAVVKQAFNLITGEAEANRLVDRMSSIQDSQGCLTENCLGKRTKQKNKNKKMNSET